MKKYEAIIIGFGKGGKTLAAALANQGKRVAIIEQSEVMYGGTCVNVGCIPTKALVHHAKLSELMHYQTFAEQAAAYSMAITKKNKLTETLRNKFFDNLDSQETVTIYTGKASFEDSHTVSIQSEEGIETISGERIFINTGATPVIPGIAGLESSLHVYTSATLMEQTELPKRLLIIGGGYIGLEFASMYAGFGAKVTVLDGNQSFLPREEREIAEAVRQSLQERGGEIKLGVTVQSVQDQEHGALVTVSDAKNLTYTLEGDAILIATGRKPNTEGLMLQQAGVKVSDRGAIEVNEVLQTNISHIYALGDVKGGPQFTYISLDDFRIILDHLKGGNRSLVQRKNIPYAVFIDPPLSRVGLTESEAIAQGYEVKISTLSAAAIPRAKLTEETKGLLKAVIDAKTDAILGCTLFCASSQEMINIVRMAMELEQPYTLLRDFIFTHPTMSEALNDLFQL
ncbi:FAD-dependent oxidoreductase [Paenibacillus gorillae]|uniref:FAD-dependent oxidoreductase n=1 Tax=Paenibacillus gorillae TaxID=1243662 RepID=UPI0004B426FC|nr:FAD-dependent oxidoreductase [Paenibacillus gorillae]